MGYILLLYDTTEKDLARDFEEFLREIGLVVRLIPRSPDLGKTLEEKEKVYLEGADGMVFLLTPGSTRRGRQYPSPSVAEEMGLAKQAFKTKPASVIYLVDRACSVQAISQASRIDFDRADMRSVLEAVTQLIRNLKAAGLYGKSQSQPRATPGIDIAAVSRQTSSLLKSICYRMSNEPDGTVTSDGFDAMLKEQYELSQQEINFAKRDLQLKGLAQYSQPVYFPSSYAKWRLTPLGYELVRFEMENSPGGKMAKLLRDHARKYRS